MFPCPGRAGSGERGLSLLELLIAMAILAVLATAVLPLAEVTVRRNKEIELRRNLREIRMAIDAYKDDFDRAVEEKKITPSINETGYPEELADLVEGKDWGGLFPYKQRYLRRPVYDPFAPSEVQGSDDWGWRLRSYQDDPDSGVWGGEDIYDVYSQSDGIALDGTLYNTW